MKDDTKNAPQAQTVRQTSIGWMMKRLCASLDADMNKKLQSVGLNINQFAVLMTLLEKEGQTQAEIGKKTVMPGYSTTRTMDALEEKGLLERRPDERSRRSHRIHLTESGRAMAPILFSIVKEVNQRFLAPLEEADRERLAIILNKLVIATVG